MSWKVVTDPVGVRHYEVDVTISVQLDGDEEDAYELVADIMQAHHEDSLRPREGHGWDYTMLEGCVTDVTAEQQILNGASAPQPKE